MYYNVVCTKKDPESEWRYCNDCILSQTIPYHCERMVERDYCFYMNHGVSSKKDMLKELSKLIPESSNELILEIIKDLTTRLKTKKIKTIKR